MTRRRDEKDRRVVWRPHEGRTWNPLRGYPRNNGCFCGSGDKAKKCCMPKLLSTVPAGEAKKIEENWDRILTGHLKVHLDEPPDKVEGHKKLNFVRPAVRPPITEQATNESEINERRDDCVSEHPLSGPDAPEAREGSGDSCEGLGMREVPREEEQSSSHPQE